MGIKRWVVEADTTITNAYKETLNGRGDLGNMGASDSLEVFSLHGQVAATGAASKESARIIIRPDVLNIRSQIESGQVPEPNSSNAPKYYLRMFNAPHPETLPVNFSLEIRKLSEAFIEGNGVDMTSYLDTGAANWKNRTNTPTVAGQGKITINASPDNSTTFTVKVDTETFIVTAGASADATRDAIIDEINNGTSPSNTASSIVTASSGGAGVVNLVADTFGTIGNYRYFVTHTTGDITTANYYMTGGNDYTPWNPVMGVDSGPWDADDAVSLVGTMQFTSGQEDILLDITSYVVGAIWDNGGSALIAENSVVNNGLIIKIQTENIAKTYYTKKFFARTSEFFFKRPCVEARWADALKDNRGKFYAKKPYMSDNNQTVYLYNTVDGSLTDLNLDGVNLYFSLYEESAFTTVVPLDVPGPSDANFVQATKISTGVYVAQMAVDTSKSSLYERWFTSTDGTASVVDVQTSELKVYQRTPAVTTKSEEYVFSITNLKPSYTRSEKPRFRLYSRLKDWSPTIYTVASKALENKIVDNVYYQIIRTTDEEVVVDYGIGTTDNNSNHTLLSYDKDGNYFDFDMSMLQAGYMYGIKFATYTNGEVSEYKKAFKFRVD
tara:strand:+ start:241 stop:2073 length:1833 start_codon:yes stop_codon:yes gene_type:complete